MKSYKGMTADMTCRGFQYEVGKEYETDNAAACECGFHACEYPLDVFNYYPPAGNRFFEVEQGGKLSRSKEDSKVASTKIKIGAELSIAGLVKAAVEYTNEHCTQGEEEHATGDWGAASVTGNLGAASATGNLGAASATGMGSIAVSSGVDGRVMGALGCAICAVERGKWDGETYPIIAVKSAIVDGKTIQPNVWYTVKNGGWEEVNDGA